MTREPELEHILHDVYIWRTMERLTNSINNKLNYDIHVCCCYRNLWCGRYVVGNIHFECQSRFWMPNIELKSLSEIKNILLNLKNWCSTHCALVKPYGDIDLSQHWVSWRLLPDSTKSILEPTLTSHSEVPWSSVVWIYFNHDSINWG